MKGNEIVKELEQIGWKVYRESELNTFLKDKNGKKIAAPKADRDLHPMLITKIEDKLDIQLTKKTDLSLDNLVNQIKGLLKDGVTSKEIKEMLREISTPKQSDKLIAMAKELIEKSFEKKFDGPEM